MSNSEFEEALINPVAFKGAPKLGPLAIMSAVRPDTKDLVKALGLNKHQHLPLNKVYFHKKKQGLCVAGPLMGAPYAAYVLEQIIAWGVTRVIFLGWCGAISPGVKIGDMIIPTSAHVDEGTSAHYSHREKGDLVRSFPDDDMADFLKTALDKEGLAYTQGSTWTTDAIFRETPERIGLFASQGALAVDMELSALQTVANFRQISLCGLLMVSDELHSGTWKPGFGDPAFQETRRKVIEVLCKICPPS